MVAKTLKEDFVGDKPMCHSVELLQHDDGSLEVVGRFQPDSDNGTYAEPLRIIERLTNKAEADFRYKITLGLMRKVGPPA